MKGGVEGVVVMVVKNGGVWCGGSRRWWLL